MPIYEYQAEYCLKSLFCSKRFSFWQNMNDAPADTACHECGAPLEKVPSLFSAGGGCCCSKPSFVRSSTGLEGSTSPPSKIFSVAGLGIKGCGHDCRSHGGHAHGKH